MKFKYHRWFQWLVVPFVALAFHIYFGYRIIGRENIPEGGCVVCPNHIQLSDPPFAAVALSHRTPLRLMAKKELFQGNKLFAWLIAALGAFPIDREGADITAIKTATRQKHIPLNSYISLNKPIYDEDSDRTLLDVISGTRITDPEELVISREEFDNIEAKMSEILSSLEWKVLMFYLEGKSYQEIANDLGRHVKSIDNALQRVKHKLERYLESRSDQDRR